MKLNETECVETLCVTWFESTRAHAMFADLYNVACRRFVGLSPCRCNVCSSLCIYCSQSFSCRSQAIRMCMCVCIYAFVYVCGLVDISDIWEEQRTQEIHAGQVPVQGALHESRVHAAYLSCLGTLIDQILSSLCAA
jgi:hypothetical protein